MKKFSCVLICLLLLNLLNVSAQCSGGETPVTIKITTDLYGYEGYWALFPSVSSCGVGDVASGGNASQVGCNGAGQQDATVGNGYGINQTVTSGPHCLVTGDSYSIKYVDDYGDGGFKFTILIDGLPMYNFHGSGNNDIFTFEASPALAINGGITQITTNSYYSAGDIAIKGKIFNFGYSVISSATVNYSINNGSAVSENLSGFSIFPYEKDYDFLFTTPWSATDTGTYSLRVWLSDVNGQTDMDSGNDMLEKTIVIGAPVPNLIDKYLTDTLAYTTIGNSSDGLNKPRDLDFHPVLNNYELWVINEEVEATGGSTVTYFNAGMPNQTSINKTDGNAWHFMSLPTAIAFSDNTNFATTAGVFDANHGAAHYTGPTLWSSDMAIYAEPSGGNGSHLDMMHQTPYGMGIAAEKENAFWVFDGNAGNIIRYDFQKDHGPGGEDHADGIVRRYTEVQVQKLNNTVPSHLVLDAQKKWLYIVDGGNQRVLKMDITTGSSAGDMTPYSEILEEYKEYTGVTWEPIITTGLVQPCGIDIMEDRLIVSDYSNGDVIIYDLSASPVTELGRVQTNQAGIQGIKIGPDGKIWYVNRNTNSVFRIDGPVEEPPVPTGIDEISAEVMVFPVPAENTLHIRIGEHASIARSDLKVFDVAGKCVLDRSISSNQANLDVAGIAPGNYILSIVNDHFSVVKKFTKQ